MELDFVKNELEILAFWEDNKCFEKLRDKNKNGKPFRFLDGPITANNPMGIHHAWGRSIKDIALRYKAMNGFYSHYRNGFDTQGLWVEVEVEKELNFKDKKDIERFGMENFTKKCVERIQKYSGIITTQSKRLGQWMDWGNSYFTHTDSNIVSIWHFLKVCSNNGWIEQSHRPLPWCPRCGTSLSEHEMSGSHKNITHTAVYAKLPVIGQSYDILVWTTTPWTLTANVALAVNPDFEYAIVEVEDSDRPFVLAKNALSIIDRGRKVLGFIKGSELIGLEYETFLPDLSVQKDLCHRIVAWDEVESNEGSGVVHIAPGCGSEDFELGKSEGLVEICPIDESGRFSEHYGFLSGRATTEATPLIFDDLCKQGKLYKTHEYNHSYPVCWRCKTEVLFRLVSSWIIKTDDIKPELIKASESVIWDPAFAGKRMQDWLIHMGDWNISRKRFYGLPLPFYLCDKCEHLTVIGSREELRKLGGDKVDALPELHRPWIDCIAIECPKCGASVNRIPDVGDVWLDAGITPFSTLGYFSNHDEWEKWFPVEWVVEMKEQIRLWFYSLLFMSVTLTGKAPYERVIAHGGVVQEDGTKFHKSGFMIRFDEAAEKVGADAVRYLYAGANISSDVRFGYNLCDDARRKLLGLWNIYTFFITYAEIDKPKITSELSHDLMDEWLDNRCKNFVETARKCYEEYNTAKLTREFEMCVDDISNWYVRLCRRRFWKHKMDGDKQLAYNALYFAIKRLCQIMAPVVPFITEYIWVNMIRKYGEAEISVHLSDFPEFQSYNMLILEQVKYVRDVIASGMKLRNENHIKVRQPLSSLYIDTEIKELCANFLQAIKDELNVKEVVFIDDWDALRNEAIKLDFKAAGRILKENLSLVKDAIDSLEPSQMDDLVNVFKLNGEIEIKGHVLTQKTVRITKVDKPEIKIISDKIPLAFCVTMTTQLRREGCYRELLRHCQVLRKEAGFNVADKVTLEIYSDNEYMMSIIKENIINIEKEALATITMPDKVIVKKEIEVNGNAVSLMIGSENFHITKRYVI
ncbi:MAG: isoleucine--tRNA ligase [Oscillospiraceae bacterium]|nr:isoleucine--tRNA ligase [Oscillospiraceae bacterium]